MVRVIDYFINILQYIHWPFLCTLYEYFQLELLITFLPWASLICFVRKYPCTSFLNPKWICNWMLSFIFCLKALFFVPYVPLTETTNWKLAQPFLFPFFLPPLVLFECTFINLSAICGAKLFSCLPACHILMNIWVIAWTCLVLLALGWRGKKILCLYTGREEENKRGVTLWWGSESLDVKVIDSQREFDRHANKTGYRETGKKSQED